MTDPHLHKLPPLARAEAMDRPYRPGQHRRQILIGAVVVAALLGAFLAWMPDRAARTASGRSVSPAPSPGVVYQNLRVAPQPPASRIPDASPSAGEAAAPAKNANKESPG